MPLTPLYNGAIFVHGMNSSPDGKIVAVAARGSSNIYLINASSFEKIGSNGGVFVGREPHVPTFTPDGQEIWVTVRGSNYIATINISDAVENKSIFYNEAIPTVNGPSMVWFSKDGRLAFVGSQKESVMDVIDVVSKKSISTVNLSKADPAAFSPFIKTTPDGKEIWLTHKNADSLSTVSTQQPFNITSTIQLENGSKPNHIEFSNGSRRDGGYYAYITLATIAPKTNMSKIIIIDTANKSIVGSFDSHGKEAHGIWANPEGTRLYVGHEQTPKLTVFDINGANATRPVLFSEIDLDSLQMPDGQLLKNEKSIDVIYDRIIIN
jgi:DNA-binding beta-propeller fold protein YncE